MDAYNKCIMQIYFQKEMDQNRKDSMGKAIANRIEFNFIVMGLFIVLIFDDTLKDFKQKRKSI